MYSQKVTLHGPAGEVHELEVDVEDAPESIALKCVYLSGSASVPSGAQVAKWEATYERPIKGIDPGQLDIGGGRLDIDIPELRGIGLGSLLMSFFVEWAHILDDVPLCPIELAASDARTAEARDRRNSFWEKLGFEFDYKDGGLWGTSKPMRSHELKRWDGNMKSGWTAT